MENGMLPKSLHTVRILVAVAARERAWYVNAFSDPTDAVLAAAFVVGYPNASMNWSARGLPTTLHRENIAEVQS